jgi:hypothetical protein
MEYTSFDSLDDMFSEMERQRGIADTRVQPCQAAAAPGDFYRQDTNYGFSIYGEILKDPEPRPEQLKHYRFVLAYSVACPDGEMGDVHVSQINEVISPAVFQVAKEMGWRDGE